MSEIDLNHLCRLAQLAPLEAELAAARADLERIIAMVDQMQAVPTEGIEPLAHPLGDAARLRPDAVTEQVDQARFQALAPEAQDGFYLVPRVVE